MMSEEQKTKQYQCPVILKRKSGILDTQKLKNIYHVLDTHKNPQIIFTQ